ncbi:hypothetical protein [Amorphus orientalis]|uniref:Uncharacterized protein n=1 Tax=Amorphus orientalis TaxID=649198 RepID=A0AAE4ATR8_9HYPH|nr:hypothetical protein [Amorphus orientalis]MDQ0316407.1 hypothetical protein [Amorphus orientalis]
MVEQEIDKDLPEEEEVDEEEEEAEEEPDEADESEEEEEDEPGDDPYADLSHEDAIKRLKKAEKAIAKHKGKGKAPKQPKEPTTKQPKGEEIPEWGQKIIQSEEKRSFGYEHQLSPEQVDAVFRYNGGKVPDEKVLKRPEVKAMIKVLQSKDRVAANTPKGGAGVVYRGKTFSEVTTDPKSSKADKQGAFDATRKRHNVG